jgi:putative ABC transport system permease protein
MPFARALSHAWRSLRRAPLFSASIVVTLAVGIGAATAIFTVVNAVLLRPLPYGHADRLVGVWFDMAPLSLNHAQQTPGTYQTFARFAHTLQDIGLYQEGSVDVSDPSGGSAPEHLTSAYLTQSVIPLLEVAPVLGRTFTKEEDGPKGPRVAMISEGLWRTRFGADPGVLGKSLVMYGRPTRIIGVMPSRFRFPNAGTEVWLPLQLDFNNPYSGGFSYDGVARLAPGASTAAAERELNGVLPRVVEVAPNLTPTLPMSAVLAQAKPIARVIPMRDDVVGGVSRTLWMVAVAAALLLIAACANVANLLLARADERQRELAVRAALGAGRARVLIHFFTESALLAALSVVLALVASWVAIHALVSAGPMQIPRLGEVHVGLASVAFALLAGLLAALASSAIPTLRFMRSDLLAGLRDGGRGGTVGGKRQRARGVLVAVQVAFALVVLAASGLLLRSFERLRAVRPGFDPAGVATLWFSLPSQRYTSDTSIVQFLSRVVDGAAQVPGVQSAGFASWLPMENEGGNHDPVYAEGEATSTTKIPALASYVSTNATYFATLGIPVVAGHVFDDRLERQHANEAVISQEAARVFFHDSTGLSAVGKRFQELPGATWYTVIGVVGSVRDTSLAAGPARTVYVPEALSADNNFGHTSRTVALVAKTHGDVGAVTRELQRMIRQLDPTLPTFGVQSMQQTLTASTAQLTFTMIVLGAAAAVTLLLSIVGLYAVIAYIVSLRTREIGVRIALGAQPSSVAASVAARGLALCGAGLAVGLVLVFFAGRFLRSFLFEVAPTDPAALAGAVVLLVGLSLAASWIPARRAARVNPVEALRGE